MLIAAPVVNTISALVVVGRSLSPLPPMQLPRQPRLLRLRSESRKTEVVGRV
jgi:hypothetical protein